MKARTAVLLTTAAVVAHAAVLAVHSAAHLALGVEATGAQLAFIVLVIMLAPPVAAGLAWTRAALAAGAGLALSMLGALLFGVYNHFVAVSPDHVSHLPHGAGHGWVLAFQVSAVLLVAAEAAGVAAGLALLGAARRERLAGG